ncbi:THAP domain-containing protein 2-like [Mycetomoellerius zeteki]|uniref:THAP domain-containing protein 2-like n=1 Tax=Mycetomoellerius zeteki TaxID=64791 RepID=UPI00084E53BE|nr:PREDICTED: THAP domain-containing protein 2-like [Trachymyrmex zeteki]XP_018301920.1 PREDICTED: THAP domain-containing protein 2-like [Trachymyrmex zeteki]XP_018301921.1 PREDICTED: THAP domain-containing protein 2-like [Trachymyrmex zeteki]
MGRCVACGARSSLSNKIKTCSFPKNEERRNSWIRAFNKPNWMPTNNSVLCEKHFSPEMWEKVRVDGKKKLKANAIPTLFGRPNVYGTADFGEIMIEVQNAVSNNQEVPTELDVITNGQGQINVLRPNDVDVSVEKGRTIEAVEDILQDISGNEVVVEERSFLKLQSDRNDNNASENASCEEQLRKTMKKLKRMTKMYQRSENLRKRMKAEHMKIRKQLQKKIYLLSIVKRAEEIDLHVHGVISDMGSANRAM